MLELPNSGNPLQTIRSNLELMMDFDLEPDEHEDYLQVIRQEIERLGEITRRVLDFAQPADDTRDPVSIARLTQKTLRLIGKQLELAHIQATTDFPADPSPIFVAPDQIVQVLLNGLGLPINHSIVHRHGGTISVENLEGDRGMAFTVTLPITHVTRLKETSA